MANAKGISTHELVREYRRLPSGVHRKQNGAVAALLKRYGITAQTLRHHLAKAAAMQ